MPKKRLLLFLFILTALSLMTYQSNRSPLLPLKSVSHTFNFLYDLKNSLVEYVKEPFRRMLLREKENLKLKAEISEMIEEQQKCREAVIENRNLREILGLKEREHRYITAARVIGRSIDQWANTVILDKGLSDGVMKDMIAVTDRGLVGKISDASSSYSRLLLLTDINFSAAARLQDGRTQGVISGTGYRKCQLKYVPYEEEVNKGAVVITSGLDELFPSGIPIGYVTQVNRKVLGFFQYIEVRPFVDNAKTEIVAIIKR
jgi:rod shape-determining protein MreC